MHSVVKINHLCKKAPSDGAFYDRFMAVKTSKKQQLTDFVACGILELHSSPSYGKWEGKNGY